jgi:hypothetical protein
MPGMPWQQAGYLINTKPERRFGFGFLVDKCKKAIFLKYKEVEEEGGGFMPWTGESFRSKHNKKLSAEEAREAAKIANAILRDTGDEAKAIRIANYAVGRKKK